MKLAITGCNGSVGKRVVLLALKRGYTVTGIDLGPPPQELNELRGFTFHQLDIKEYDTVLEVLSQCHCEGVIHLAALRDPTDYRVQTHNSNVVISWNILRACAELGITRIAQASSVNVIPMYYSNQPRFQYFPIDENHPCEPDEPYGLSKVICELQADTIVRRYPSLRIASLRLHWSLPDRSPAGRPGALQRAAKHLWGYVQEDSAADAFLLAVAGESGKWSGHEAFFIVAPEIAPEADSGELRKTFWPDVPIRDGKDISGRKGFFDCTKAERLLGWVHRDTMLE